jgi:hypothetical protein
MMKAVDADAKTVSVDPWLTPEEFLSLSKTRTMMRSLSKPGTFESTAEKRRLQRMADLEKRLTTAPLIPASTITIDGNVNGRLCEEVHGQVCVFAQTTH